MLVDVSAERARAQSRAESDPAQTDTNRAGNALFVVLFYGLPVLFVALVAARIARRGSPRRIWRLPTLTVPPLTYVLAALVVFVVELLR